MQQSMAGEPAAEAGSRTFVNQQPPLADCLSVEVPAAAQPDVPAATEAVDVPIRSAERSPDELRWSDPLQTVRLPSHHPVQ